MDKNSSPLDYLIELCEQASDYGTITKFTILNARDELKRLRSKSEKDPVAWAKINDRGDLYDLRLQNNPYTDQSKVIALYRID